MSVNVHESPTSATTTHNTADVDTNQGWLTRNSYRIVFVHIMLLLVVAITTNPASEDTNPFQWAQIPASLLTSVGVCIVWETLQRNRYTGGVQFWRNFTLFIIGVTVALVGAEVLNVTVWGVV